MTSLWLALLTSLLLINQSSLVFSQTYTTDGFGNRLLFPQCTTFLNDGSIAVFHFGLDGVTGQQGISIFNPQTNNQSDARSISMLRQRVNGPIPPIFQFTVEFWDTYDACSTMFTINRTIDESNIELIAFVLPLSSSPSSQKVLIDRDGYYYGQWSNDVNPLPILSFSINDEIRKFVVRQGFDEMILVDFYDETIYQTIDTQQFWIQTKSRAVGGDHPTTNGVDKLFWSTSLTSTTSSSHYAVSIYAFHFTINQSIISVQLVSTIIEPEYYSGFSGYAIGQFALSQMDGSVIYSAPGNFWNGSPGEIRHIYPSFNYQPYTPAKGEIAEIINLGVGIGIGVFHSDSSIITYNGALVIQRNNNVISTISELSGVTDQDRANGISTSLRNYTVITIYVDRLDRIYLTTFKFIKL